MQGSGRTLSLRTVIAALALTVASTAVAAPGDEYWDDSFYINGLNDYVRCITVGPKGDVYVGGGFETADDVAVNYIARWDGTEWHALGDGLNGSVNAIVIDTNGYLYAGGYFTDAGGDPEGDRVAVWNGSAWASIGGRGSGLGGAVLALAFDSSGDLYAGGSFNDAGGDADADKIAVWNGSAWASIGGAESGLGSNVYAIAFSSTGTLVAGGSFTDAGGSAAADRIAGWTGSSWSAIGGGLNGTVRGLVFADSGALYVGGAFTDAGGDPDADGIAIWRSPTWTSVGGASSGLAGTVYTIDLDGPGGLVVGGSFVDAGGDADADRVAWWSGTGWTSLGGPRSGLNNKVQALAIGDGGTVLAGGDFTDAGGYNDGDGISEWDGSRWSSLSEISLPAGSGLDDYVYALALDSGGRLVAGGEFSNAGDDPAADYVAVWNGTGWSTLGGPSLGVDDIVRAVAVTGADHIVAGGEFSDAGGDPDADYIAIWDGVAWTSLGGAGSGLSDYALALAIGGDGRIYAGGSFQDAGGDPDADYVAVWDGVAWSALGGPNSGLEGLVNELLLDDAGNLFAGGQFDDAGGDPDADHVAVWNGSTWSSIGGPGSGLDFEVFALALDDTGRLIAASDGLDLGGNPDADNIAAWDGAAWVPLGTGLNGVVHDLVSDGAGLLYAAGLFKPTISDPTSPRFIAVFGSRGWEDLGSGLNSDAHALVYDGGNRLFVGGEFTTAGATASNRIGLYTGVAPAGPIFQDGFESSDTSAWSGSVN